MSIDKILSESIDQAREAAVEAAEGFSVGDYIGARAEDGTRIATHYFAADHPGYIGWQWAVTMVRATRAKYATVNEVSLVPAEGALLAPEWVPWTDRVEPGDITPGVLLPTPDNDPRLEPGYTSVELGADEDPMDWAQTRAVASELGLGRERVLSLEGKDSTAQRWLDGAGGPDNEMTRKAPATCDSCGYMVALTGALGRLFGVCANEYSPSDGRVVSIDHGCGGHADVTAQERGIRLSAPVLDTVTVDQGSLFD